MKSNRSRLVALLLCCFLGEFGAHRFYVGKIGTAILYIFTLGFLGIGVITDIILICSGTFKDIDNKELTDWNVK